MLISLGYQRVTVQLHKNSFRIICQGSSCGFCLLVKVQIKAFVLWFCSSVAQGEDYSFSSIVSKSSQITNIMVDFLLGFSFAKGYPNFGHFEGDPSSPLKLSISFILHLHFISTIFLWFGTKWNRKYIVCMWIYVNCLTGFSSGDDVVDQLVGQMFRSRLKYINNYRFDEHKVVYRMHSR